MTHYIIYLYIYTIRIHTLVGALPSPNPNGGVLPRRHCSRGRNLRSTCWRRGDSRRFSCASQRMWDCRCPTTRPTSMSWSTSARHWSPERSKSEATAATLGEEENEVTLSITLSLTSCSDCKPMGSSRTMTLAWMPSLIER
jgi:hypothetical protein